MQMKKIVILCAFAAFALCARAQSPDPDTTARHFIIMASIGNLQEVNSGQLAVQKGMTPGVKSFGQMMVNDHSQAQQKLMALAKRKGIDVPPEASSGIMADLKLKNATDAFDRLYVHNMLADHRSTVQMFETYAITGKDPDVRAFAQQTLPTLKQHLAEVKALDEKLKDQVAK
jgi:putative membrane protein